MGGVLTAEVARRLRSRAVVGPANNQLAAPEVADLLHQRGVLWAPDELVGAGGVTYAQMRTLIHGLIEKGRVVGMDIVEITPKRDVNGISAITAGRLIVNLIGKAVRAGYFAK